jgi:hypothetical protein
MRVLVENQRAPSIPFYRKVDKKNERKEHNGGNNQKSGCGG